jgi:RHS repeat-associated protein
MRHLLFAGIAALFALAAQANVYVTPVVTAKGADGRVYVTATVLGNTGAESVKCESAYTISDDAKGGTLRGAYEIQPGHALLDESTLRQGGVGTIRFACSGPLLIAANIRSSADGGKTFDSVRMFRSASTENPVRATASRSIKPSSDLLLMEVGGKPARLRVIAKDSEGKVLLQVTYDTSAYSQQIVNLSAVRLKCSAPVVEISVTGRGAVAVATQSDDASLAALFKPDRGHLPAAESSAATVIQMLGLSSFKAAPFLEPMTGHVYMRGRWYDPRTGSFLTPDPAGYKDSANLYSYCGGDPVNCSDPTGEISLKAALTDRVINDYEMKTLSLTDEEISTIIGSQNAVKIAGRDDPDRKKHNMMRAKFILLTRNQDFGQYTKQLYELTRGLNPVQFSAETGWAIGSGQEPIFGSNVNRGDKVLELATYLAFMKGTDFVLSRLYARALPAGIVTNKPAFVIGEGMEDRVIPYAREVGAEYYTGAGPNVRETEMAYFEHNRQVIRNVIQEGREIIDIGPNPARRSWPAATSPNYQMELDEIVRANYRNYVRQTVDDSTNVTSPGGHGRAPFDRSQRGASGH